MSARQRVAVVLFNLGGPDAPEAVRPFLFNLFNDKAIIRLPGLPRRLLAWLISTRRAPIAREIYQQMGGRSPILPETEAQAHALMAALADDPQVEFRPFICMRYWRPQADEIAKEVKEYAPDKLVLLPLYPQYSTTTTASSFKAWQEAAERVGLTAPSVQLCCYPMHSAFITAHVERLREAIASIHEAGNLRILFSAHGLPEKIIRDGDPYQWQVEQGIAAIMAQLGDGYDYLACYQSRVGPMQWIGPATDAAIIEASKEGKHLIIVPIAFVSEHSETLVELDIEYAELATHHGAAGYTRIPALGVQRSYIQSLAMLARQALGQQKACASHTGERVCPASFSHCAMRENHVG